MGLWSTLGILFAFATGCSSNASCGAESCSSTLNVLVERKSNFGPGRYHLAVIALSSVLEQDCAVAAGLGACVPESSAPSSISAFIDGTGTLALAIATDNADVEVLVFFEGSLAARAEVNAKVSRPLQPNGVGCPPTCREAWATVVVPG